MCTMGIWPICEVNQELNTCRINDGFIWGKVLFFTEAAQIIFTDIALSVDIGIQKHVVFTVAGSNGILLQLSFHFIYQRFKLTRTRK